jgi:hypothetical protein
MNESFNLKNLDRRFASKLKALGPSRCVRSNKIHSDLAIFDDRRVSVFYAPLGERLSIQDLEGLKVLFVGLTPGFRQAEAAYKEYFNPNALGNDAISFEGPMRTNLVKLMDALRLPSAMGIKSTSQLFEKQYGHLAESTSLLRYPVFLKGKNYSGSPHPNKHEFLERMVRELFIPLMHSMTPKTLIVPLGTRVTEQVEIAAKDLGPAFLSRCLIGFPHTSGANNGRIAEYQKSGLPKIHARQIRKLFA